MDDTRLKRLIYRSAHRGCKETDLILGPFAQAQLTALSPPMVDLYECLLDENDADIWDWLTGKRPSPEKYALLIDVLKDCAETDE